MAYCSKVNCHQHLRQAIPNQFITHIRVILRQTSNRLMIIRLDDMHKWVHSFSICDSILGDTIPFISENISVVSFRLSLEPQVTSNKQIVISLNQQSQFDEFTSLKCNIHLFVQYVFAIRIIPHLKHSAYNFVNLTFMQILMAKMLLNKMLSFSWYLVRGMCYSNANFGFLERKILSMWPIKTNNVRSRQKLNFDFWVLKLQAVCQVWINLVNR